MPVDSSCLFEERVGFGPSGIEGQSWPTQKTTENTGLFVECRGDHGWGYCQDDILDARRDY